MTESREDRIKRLLREASPESSKSEKIISIYGDRNVVGENNTIIHTEKVIHRPRYEVRPGEDHISARQRRTLYDLVHQIVEIESHIKQRPSHFKKVWSALNRRMGVPSYKLIAAVDYEAAEKYLRQWKGRLQASRSASDKDPSWRQSRYKYIHTNTRALGLVNRMRDHIAERFGAISLKELSDNELDAVYHTVAGWKSDR